MSSRSTKAKHEIEVGNEPTTRAAQDTLSAEQVEEGRQRAVKAKQVQACFGQIVTLLLRSSADRQRPLQDLEWMVIPALNAGQFAIAEAQAKERGVPLPVGAVLWALVSADLDARLTESPDQPVTLRPEDWHSGDIPWIMATIGDPKVVGGLLQQLSKTVFKARSPKIRVRTADGTATITHLQPPMQANSET